jgi:hypothetical protein
MCANNGELEMTRKIQEAIQEMIVDEKIYMIEREFRSIHRAARYGCIKEKFGAQLELLHYMISRVHGETEAQRSEIKELSKEIEKVYITYTGCYF